MRQERITLVFTKGRNTHELVFERVARVPTSSTLADDKCNESYSEYATALFNRVSTVKHRHAKTSKMQNLDLSDIMIVK